MRGTWCRSHVVAIGIPFGRSQSGKNPASVILVNGMVAMMGTVLSGKLRELRKLGKLGKKLAGSSYKYRVDAQQWSSLTSLQLLRCCKYFIAPASRVL